MTGAPVCAYDLRAGVALIIAGAFGTTIVGVDHVERGYEDIVTKRAISGGY